jgi:hypothetical protein
MDAAGEDAPQLAIQSGIVWVMALAVATFRYP